MGYCQSTVISYSKFQKTVTSIHYRSIYIISLIGLDIKVGPSTIDSVTKLGLHLFQGM